MIVYMIVLGFDSELVRFPGLALCRPELQRFQVLRVKFWGRPMWGRFRLHFPGPIRLDCFR